MSDHIDDLIKLSSTYTTESFLASYRDTFTLVKAQSPEELEACFKLRYLVYCAENGYQKFHHSERLEYDGYDRNAVHYLLIHNETKKPVGTVRIILPDLENAHQSFPIQKICHHPLLRTGKKPQMFCQISRLCMHPEFRRRDADGHLLPAYHEQEDIKGKQDGNLVFIRRRIPYAPLALFAAAFETALKNQTSDCLMLVEADQLPHFSRIGIPYIILGPKVRNNGIQQPIALNIKNVLDTMAIENPQCWEVVSGNGRLHKIAAALDKEEWRGILPDEADWDRIWNPLF